MEYHPDSTAFDEIHIVSHSNPWRGMAMRIRPNGDRITQNSLQAALTQEGLPVPEKAIDSHTRLIFHACGLGENTVLLSMLKEAFSGAAAPEVYASPHYNVFGSRFSPHYLASVYYAYYPTAESPGPRAIAQAFRQSYPDVHIDWQKAMKTREPKAIGEVYSYRYNVPVEWSFEFADSTEIPHLSSREAIMDWVSEQDAIVEVLFAFNIPLEQYRWRTQVADKTLTIQGKTTVLCVMEPTMEAGDPTEYQHVDISNPTLYTKL